MKIKDIFRRWLPMRWQRIGNEDPLSMVLLLREAHFFKKEELQLAAARAWRMQFTGDSPKHCVVQSGSTTLVKAGPHLLSLFHFAEPYIEDHRENIEWLALESQRRVGSSTGPVSELTI